MSKGLKGIIAAETSISMIDGEKGLLIYRGFDAKELALTRSFEESAYLIWHGELPDESQLDALKVKLKKKRMLQPETIAMLKALPADMELMAAIRTVISSMGTRNFNEMPVIEQAIELTAVIPSIIAWRYRESKGLLRIEPDESLNHVENFLYMLTGEKKLEAKREALEAYMILTMEHGMNASSFAARVIASTESDLASAVTGAAGAMKGPLHGGAPSGVIELLNDIESGGEIERILRLKLNNGEKLMGFGHRVYKTADPRAIALREIAHRVSGNNSCLELAVETEDCAVKLLKEYKPGRNLYANVEFYAAAVMKAIGMEDELFTPAFTAARITGWTAHVMEQWSDNAIYRPDARYIGVIKEKG
ncbi:citrate/2-methylcitrate synthase [Actinomycetes bacterium NPDC127524]